MSITALNSAKSAAPDKGHAAKSVAKENPENKEKNREKNKSLLAHVGDTAQNITENVARQALYQTTDAAKQGTKGAVNILLHTTFYPVTVMLQSLDRQTGGMAQIAISTIAKWLSPKLDAHFKELGVNLKMPTDQIIHNLLMGNYDALSTEASESIASFVENVMPPEVRQALESGNPVKIARATGMSLAGGVKDMVGQIKSERGWLMTAPFKWLGKKIPYMNRLPKAAQPWAAGGLIVLFGGFILRGMKKLIKLAAGGALLATAWGFAQKALKGGMQAGSRASGLGNIMGAVSGLAGGARPGASGSGAGGMLDMGMQAFGALSKMRR